MEFEGPFRSAEHLFPLATEPEILACPTCHDARFYDLQRRELVMSFHALLVRTPTHTILVDTCIGNDKPRALVPEWNARSGRFLEDLASLGVRPADVDFVLCTHLHADHVGWNTRLEQGRWVPTFPRARHLFARRELEHFRTRIAREGAGIHHGMWGDSVQPVIDAGLAELVDEHHEVAPGVTLHPAFGHTPGTVMIRLDDGRDTAWLTGDVVHHPIQVDRPDWYSRFCEQPAQAVASRIALLGRLADTAALMIPAHFPTPTRVRIERAPKGYRTVTD